MAFVFQIISISLLTGLFAFLIISLLRKFNQEAGIAVFFIIPLAVFSLGFVFRLSVKPSIVDLGFFLTDFSGLFISVLFAVCLFLGQIRYWKK